jgi:thioredoxin reductase (NADPH)
MKRAARPASILVVDVEEQEPSQVLIQLRRRYGSDYDIVVERSADAGLQRLARMRDEGREVAIVLAGRRLPDGSGIDFLAQARRFDRSAKRAVLVSWADAWGGDPAGTEALARATALGEVDNYVLEPAVDPDEQFHHAIGELIDEWARRHRPGFEVIRIVGDRWSEDTHRLRDGLDRSSVPFGFYEPHSPEGRALLEQAGASGPLPIAIFHDGRVFLQPRPIDIVEALGLALTAGPIIFDVAVVGAGPAGLAAAVHAASEGLRVLVIESEVIGGQAATSSMIRNYLGFPRGLSGAELTLRAYQQAWYFGAKFLIARRATALRPDGDLRVLTLDDGSEVRTRAVVLAVGVSYLRMQIPSLDALVGRGVFYGGAATEAQALRGEEVFVVGGANSAGQAAVHLARFAAMVTLLVRGPSIATGMSRYLVHEIEAASNIAVRLNTEIVAAGGEERLRSLTLRDRAANTTEAVPATAVFVLIGAVPRTAWLPEEVQRDARGFVLTGGGLARAGDSGGGRTAPLETSLPGVYAVGDVRADSIKRVASCVGEGSVAIRFVHEYLAARAADRERDGAGGLRSRGRPPREDR